MSYSLPLLIQQKYPQAVAYRFGDSAALNAEILELVVRGLKTATCTAASFFDPDNPPPVVGRTDIACDWNWQPICATRTDSFSTMSFTDMSEAKVAAQGEFTDLADWQASYQRYFERSGVYDPDMLITYEEFTVVDFFTKM